MEDPIMAWQRMAGMACTLLALAAGAAQLSAEEKGQRHDRLAALAGKLALTDKQKEEIRGIHKEFDGKADPIVHQLWALHRQEFEAVHKVLTDDQRAKLPMLMKAHMEKELKDIAAQLNLTDDQKQKIAKMREEYEKKYHDVAGQKGEAAHKQYRELRHQFFEEVAAVLTEEQRVKLPGVLHEEFHHWRDPAVRREFLKGLGAQLNLSADQKEQIKKIHGEYDAQITKLAAELKQAHKEEREAIEKVLTPDQKGKFQDLLKSRGRGEK
jgi:Spy/CpxP family protein refolding chaperone